MYLNLRIMQISVDFISIPLPLKGEGRVRVDMCDTLFAA